MFNYKSIYFSETLRFSYFHYAFREFSLQSQDDPQKQKDPVYYKHPQSQGKQHQKHHLLHSAHLFSQPQLHKKLKHNVSSDLSADLHGLKSLF